MLNRIIIPMALFACAATAALPVTEARSDMKKHGMEHHDPEAKADKLSDKLDLTEEQTRQVTEIFKSTKEKMENLRQEKDRKLRAILNEEQERKYDAWHDEKKGSDKSAIRGELDAD